MLQEAPFIDDLIVAYLKGFNWWFGKIISYEEVKADPPVDGFEWIYWFGDKKVSQVRNYLTHKDIKSSIN